MASGSIGTVDVDIIRSRPVGLKSRVEKWEIMGLDGYGSMILGNGDAEFKLMTITYLDSDADAESHIADCEGLQGSIITVTDNWGNDYDNVLIEHVDTNNSKFPVIYQGNAEAVRVVIFWDMCTSS